MAARPQDNGDTVGVAESKNLRPGPDSTRPALLAEGLNGDGVISREELELGLQVAARGSAPGMNDLPYKLYRAFEATLLPVLLRVFNIAYRNVGNQAPLTVLLRSVICLIKKADVPAEELTSYKTITFLNCEANQAHHARRVQPLATPSRLHH